ncbi:MAG: hypothetical protein KZQ83_03930 [gamma proteobacterium symbiont of Taylorina sp.]|nr:hypothetical protein [gamma proteobacterium symbiont of Taylorina sp.]
MIKNILNIFIVIFMILMIMNIADDMSSSVVTKRALTYDSYVDVNGNIVLLDEFQGNYLWVDYAAEWCSYCEPQTRTMKALDRKMGDQILFLTVMTSTKKVMEPPAAITARQWANRFNLDSDMVLAKFSTKTLPYHLLYSPSGTILFQGSGLYNENKISSIINKYLQD